MPKRNKALGSVVGASGGFDLEFMRRLMQHDSEAPASQPSQRGLWDGLISDFNYQGN